MLYPVLFIIGAVLGSWTNWFVDRYCWTPRFRSPWRVWPTDFLDKINAVRPERKRRKKEKSTSLEPFAKTRLDFVPILGWFSLARLAPQVEALPNEQRLPGLESGRFWLRPFFVELCSAFGVCWLFWWEVEAQMLRPDGVGLEPWNTVALRFAVHVVLLIFLSAAALIDIDDMIIPDILTVPGTLLGLSLAALLPQTLLPATEIRTEVTPAPYSQDKNIAQQYDVKFSVSPNAVPLNLCSPNPIPKSWEKTDGSERRTRLGIMFACWAFWCFAMTDRVWYFKLPFKKAAMIFWRRWSRSPNTALWIKALFLFPLVFLIPIAAFNLYKPPDSWSWFPLDSIHLYSALIGMAVGMGLIWGTRLIGGAALGREAMGFGDVTLMGLIGAFVGWQSCILIFFLAPVAGLLLWVLNAAVGRGREVPYGPFLCLATAMLIVGWSRVWTQTALIFELGWIVGLVMLICLVLLGVLLVLWRKIRDRIFQAPNPKPQLPNPK